MPQDSSNAIPLKRHDDNHSIEMVLGCLCNSAAAHWVTLSDNINRGSSQTGGSQEPKCLWGYESYSRFSHHAVAIAVLLCHEFAGVKTFSECKESA